ncbi:hypothetical protein AURDEDRAFT_163769 [Auricularia subglabra TFB-10046 SS5]|nr:hypothetical protein AURDEDRAFT_163769 [Auricularia subglabra TFB-10046 SS5]
MAADDSPQATIREVFERALEEAEATVSAPPVRIPRKAPVNGVASKFKLPRDVAAPITGTEDIHTKYRVFRTPAHPTKAIKRRGHGISADSPSKYRSQAQAMDSTLAADLAADLQKTGITDDNEPVPRDATSSRVPYTYTVNCLAADLQIASLLGRSSTGDAKADNAAAET